ncbi:hypothetical protein [Novosphingobium sp.]|uniref:hypothetical protein n=1 Tax=Novosphingobium sp. TaxID=1874826 RepID=UPI003D6CA9DA
MRQSITTRYLGPTNSRDSRIKATARKRSASFPEQGLSVPYGYGNTEEEHCKGAKALAEKLGWSGLWVGGGNVDENGFVYVNIAKPESWGLMASSGSLGVEGRDWFHAAAADT